MSLTKIGPIASSSILNPALTSPQKKEKDKIRDIIKNSVIFFIGYPGSGKGTQGKKLADELNVRHLSTGELFRAEAEKKTDIGLKMDSYMQKGQVIPKDLTFAYLKQELSKPEYRNGFILDGYPKNLESYEFIMQTLKELQIQPLAALHFDISREKVLDRLAGRRHCTQCKHDFHLLYLPPKQANTCDQCTTPLEQRLDDSESAIKQRLDVFEKNTSPVMREFTKQGLLIPLDAEKKPEEINRKILSLISDIGRKQIEEYGAYHLRIPQGQERSSVFHNHIDAQSHSVLRSIIQKEEAVHLHFQNKIYPVSHLQLGPQVQDAEFASVYQHLPNFHSIHNASDEAFSTGKMGNDGFDYEQVNETLKVAYQHPNQGVMTELEEDIYQKEFDALGNGRVVLDKGHTPYAVDWSKLPGWKEKQIPNVPHFELHHGFDLAKTEGESIPPILPSELNDRTTKNGFQTGGWFIFRKKGYWSYRSNQFSNHNYELSLNTLNQQALQLRHIVKQILPNRELSSSCSMEKVHAMWRV